MLSEEYIVLFNAITDAIRILAEAQKQAEEFVISKPSATFELHKQDS